MSRFFPPALTLERREEIKVLKQGEDENLYTSWERLKRLLKRCPMHGIELTTQMYIFYYSMNYTSKGIIDVACHGAFKRKSAKEARQLIEDLAKCNYRAPFETLGSSSRLKESGVIELNIMTTIKAILDALMNKMGNQDRRMHSAHEVEIVERNEQKISAKEGLAHEGPYQVEEAQFLNVNRSYSFKPNLNLPTHNTPALRNHENFSYGGGAQQGPRPMQNFQQQFAPHGFQGQQKEGSQRAKNQGQRRSHSFEDQMFTFIGKNKRLLNIHEQKFSKIAVFQVNKNVFQANTNASLKNLETQVGQLALSMKNHSKMPS